MRPLALLSAIAIIVIILMASFGIVPADWVGIQLASHNLPDSVRDSALFVCPAASNVFDEISRGLLPFRTQFTMVFFFFFMLLLATTGWAVYQNLVKDKFEQKAYDFPFFLGKALLWTTLIVTILMHAPNSFRAVGISGAPGKFVLCESTTPGSRPVRATAVISRSKIIP
ncbi:MAG: hypothetical protein FWG18_02400 [Alphaproteobacteria bacterium]|nr:hypothetical protein [Alphaproteobacteria bacterium]